MGINCMSLTVVRGQEMFCSISRFRFGVRVISRGGRGALDPCLGTEVPPRV